MTGTTAQIGPLTILVYVCRECGVWTIHRRNRCAWCPCDYAPELVQYTREGAE
jgi:hypothetical protein